MIPPFDDNGFLPPGIHPANLDEIELRFGGSTEIRQAQFQSVRWLLEVIQGQPGILRVILNGSFATNVPEPNDVDCAILVDELFDPEGPIADQLEGGFPFLYPEVVDETNFSFLVDRFFATDRETLPKGMIEVLR